MKTNRRVAYFYNGILCTFQDEIGNINYGQDHPMKPKRISMTHSLVDSYDLYRQMDKPHFATMEEMSSFHSLDYLKYLELSASKISNFGSNIFLQNDQTKQNLDCKKDIYKIDLTTDCPTFHGLYDFCQISTGGSFDSAVLLAENQCDIAINWAGGLHHAKKQEASGFCYVNDIVISILTLVFTYILDVHHGDGVEEAFYLTNRVMTLSFHEYGEGFFPGSGNYDSIGEGEGKGYSINVPLKQGIDDQQYIELFKNVVKGVLDHYRPNIIILQCGADSIASDLLGHFNLSSKAHGQCVEFVLNQGFPTMMLGGGGYTIENVARCWANETAIALNQELSNRIPMHDKYLKEYQKGDFKIHIPSKSGVENKNTQQDINNIQQQVFQILHQLEPAPGIPFHDPIDIKRYYDLNEIELNNNDIDQLDTLGKDVKDNNIVQNHKIQEKETIYL